LVNFFGIRGIVVFCRAERDR